MALAHLGSVTVGDGHDVAVMGVLNVSADSFYAGSVAATPDALVRAGEAMLGAGAALVDVGAMSTAPYGGSRLVGEDEEAERLARAIELLVTKLGAPVSADTARARPARAALEAGASVVNDVTGLADPALAPLVARANAALILMASEGSGLDFVGIGSGSGLDSVGIGSGVSADPVGAVTTRLAEVLGRARDAGVAADRIALDPGLGFFRGQGLPWHEWDCRVLAGLGRLRALGRPLCVGASRKSFIGALAGAADPADRLPGSLAAAVAAVLRGADLIRAHDVAETVQAVRVAEAVRRAGER